MPIDYEIESGIIEVHMHGKVTSQEFARYLNATAEDPRYRSDLRRLITIADDATFPPSAEIIQYATKMPARQLAPTVRFACVGRSPLAAGIASMFMGNAGLGDNYTHALSDPIRVEVVGLLIDGERCVCDLIADLELQQSRLSWHLKTLVDAGIITGRREGRWNYYSLNKDVLAEAKDFLDALKPSRRLTVRASC
jgi:ArsR family transcriptional regulator